jgi:hypothetical protein
VPSYGSTIRLQSIVDHAKALFPQVTGTSLSRILKTAFPECCKISPKKGVSYHGLVRRPEVRISWFYIYGHRVFKASEFNDENLMAAVEDVLHRRSDPAAAASVFKTDEMRIVKILVWYHDFKLQKGDAQAAKEKISASLCRID